MVNGNSHLIQKPCKNCIHILYKKCLFNSIFNTKHEIALIKKTLSIVNLLLCD